MMIGHRESENAAMKLRDAFASRVNDDMTIPLGDIDYFRNQYAYPAKSSTNFLLNIIFKQNELIADLRQERKSSMQDKYVPSEVSHPSHYSAHNRECIVEMLILFGLDNFITFCQMNAWKYRYRAGFKANNSADQDNAKADRYIEYAARARKIKYWDIDPMCLTDDDYWDDYYNRTYRVKGDISSVSTDVPVESPEDA